MQKHAHHLPRPHKLLMAIIALNAIMWFNFCGSNQQKGTDTTEAAQAIPEENFHADYDIAMAVRSLVDAIKVGEPLDSTDYDYTGVLTDGQGSPLYTDIQGSPGVWKIDVITPLSASIKNLYIGDLLADDLQIYILDSLEINQDSRKELEDDPGENDDETDIFLYDFEGGTIQFEIRAATAPNGLEGPLVTILLTSDRQGA